LVLLLDSLCIAVFSYQCLLALKKAAGE